MEVLIANTPPSIEIDGPNRGNPGIVYEFVINITDPDGDDNFLYVDWGDGTYEDWMGPYGSGEPIIVSHVWDEKGLYVIKVNVKDDCGESGWAELEVEIPRNRLSTNWFFLWLSERFPLLEKLLNLIKFI